MKITLGLALLLALNFIGLGARAAETDAKSDIKDDVRVEAPADDTSGTKTEESHPPRSRKVEKHKKSEKASRTGEAADSAVGPKRGQETDQSSDEAPDQAKDETPEETTPTKPKPKTETVPRASEEPALEKRVHPFNLGVQGSWLGLAIPTKYGALFSWDVNHRWTLEAGYFAGSYSVSSAWIDIGGFKETLISADARFFLWHSLNFLMGLSRQSYNVTLGSDVVSRMTDSHASFNVLDVQTLGLQLGFGNRWHYDSCMFGVDWLVLNFPFYTLRSELPALSYISNNDDLRRIGDAMTVLRYLPTGALIKLQLGYSF